MMAKIRKGDTAVHMYYGYRVQHVEKNMVEIQQILETSKNGKYPVLVLSKQSLLKQIEDSISALQELKSAIAAIDEKTVYPENGKESEENPQRVPKENKFPKRKKEALKNKKTPEDQLLEAAVREAEEVPPKEETVTETPTAETPENQSQPQIDDGKDYTGDDTGITGDLLSKLGF